MRVLVRLGWGGVINRLQLDNKYTFRDTVCMYVCMYVGMYVLRKYDS